MAAIKHYDCLIVDDEKELASSSCEYFNMFDVKTHFVLNADEMFTFLRENTVSLILLDINLGESSGFNLCKKLRETLDIPILFISARTSNEDMLTALNIGGDDYIQKPYSLSVLLAKVKAVLKRYGGSKAAQSTGRLRINAATELIYLDNSVLSLTNMEYKLLKYLIDNKGKIIGKDEIFAQVWQDKFTGDGTLNVHIRRLREKIEKDPNEPLIIKTVWGVGYVYEGDSV
jgi:two-component system response regulator RegX3